MGFGESAREHEDAGEPNAEEDAEEDALLHASLAAAREATLTGLLVRRAVDEGRVVEDAAPHPAIAAYRSLMERR